PVRRPDAARAAQTPPVGAAGTVAVGALLGAPMPGVHRSAQTTQARAVVGRLRKDDRMSAEAMLPCFKCGKTLRNAFAEQENQPADGTEFRTYGHYGSTFWDSFDGEELVLNVCDDCLR